MLCHARAYLERFAVVDRYCNLMMEQEVVDTHERVVVDEEIDEVGTVRRPIEYFDFGGNIIDDITKRLNRI